MHALDGTKHRTTPPLAAEITVVLQGPVLGKPGDPPAVRITQRSIASVRKHLPGARILLSTWEGADVSGLDVDELIFSPDPGAFPLFSGESYQNNINRQIVSSAAGLARVTTPYAMKLRSDLVLDHAGFLDYFDRFREYHPHLRAVKSRMVTVQYYARIPRRSTHRGLPFHPSDWVHFGRTSDLRALWELPLVELDEQHWFDRHDRPAFCPTGALRCRYLPEQTMWLGLLRKNADLRCEHAFDLSERTVDETELSFANNLVILSLSQFGVRSLKVRVAEHWDPAGIVTHTRWLTYYSRYCDPSVVVPFFDAQKYALHVSLALPEAFSRMSRANERAWRKLEKFSTALRARRERE